ncbi:hypothetical protein IC582_020940 [Cucumis melo]
MAAFMVSFSNTKRRTLDFLVPRPKVRVCQAWCARIVKFVGMKAVADGNGGLWPEFLVVAGKERSWRSSKGLARRIVKDLTMNWPPNLRPFTSEHGLKEKSEADFVVWSFGCWCFCFLLCFLLFFVSVSSMSCSSLCTSFFSFVVMGFVVSVDSIIKNPI